MRSEENFFRGFRAPRPPGPYSQADRWGIYFYYNRLSFSYINVLPLLMLITSATHSPARRMRVREGGLLRTAALRSRSDPPSPPAPTLYVLHRSVRSLTRVRFMSANFHRFTLTHDTSKLQPGRKLRQYAH